MPSRWSPMRTLVRSSIETPLPRSCSRIWSAVMKSCALRACHIDNDTPPATSASSSNDYGVQDAFAGGTDTHVVAILQELSNLLVG